jgi:hypothetical protein
MPDSSSDKMPFRYPKFSELQGFLTPERIQFVRNSPERVAFVQDLASKLARDPVFMAQVEAMLREHGTELDQSAAAFELASFGWTPSKELPSPRAAAAAVGAAVAAMVVPVPVPI